MSDNTNARSLYELADEIQDMLSTTARVKGEAYRHALLACFNAHTCMMLAVGVIETDDEAYTERARTFVTDTMVRANKSLMVSFSIAIFPDNNSMGPAEIDNLVAKRATFVASIIKDLEGLLTKNLQYIAKGI